MKELHRVEIVDGLLLEWRRYRSAIGPWTSEVSLYEKDEETGDWKRCATMRRDQADELQSTLRQAVLEIGAACDMEPQESAGKKKVFPDPDPPESTLGNY